MEKSLFHVAIKFFYAFQMIKVVEARKFESKLLKEGLRIVHSLLYS